MKFNKADFGDKRQVEQRLSPSAEDLSLPSSKEQKVIGPVELTLQAEELEGGGVCIRVEATTPYRFVCSRCLESFDKTLSAKSTIHDDSDSDAVEMGGEIREAILLGVPLYPVCKTSCAGLCQTCGQNLNKKHCSCRQEKKETPFSKLKEFKLS